MKRVGYVLVLFLSFSLSLIPLNVHSRSEREVLLLQAQGPLTPALIQYLERGISRAERRNAEAIIFQLDTPGGQIDLMNRMVQAIRASNVPVVVYVAPRGAMAGSAGLMIVLAGHVAAMAPETAIGAASPVGGQGEDLGETIEAKEKEILKATVRTLTKNRSESAVELAEAAIDEAKAASVEEAFDVGLIDIIASDMADLLEQLDGRSVSLVSGERKLNTSDVEIVEMSQSFIEEFLHTLTNPNIVFLLLTVGVQAILIEISSPGGWIAGFIGVVCLALGTYGLGVLPVNWFGLIFIITSFVLFVLDIKAPTHGALTIGGVVSLVAGAMILFNSPLYRVSISAVVTVASLTGAFFAFAVAKVVQAQRRPPVTGSEGLLGERARVRVALDPEGKILVKGELWDAVAEEGFVAVGDWVEVVAVEGFRLRVRRKA